MGIKDFTTRGIEKVIRLFSHNYLSFIGLTLEDRRVVEELATEYRQRLEREVINPANSMYLGFAELMVGGSLR